MKVLFAAVLGLALLRSGAAKDWFVEGKVVHVPTDRCVAMFQGALCYTDTWEPVVTPQPVLPPQPVLQVVSVQAKPAAQRPVLVPAVVRPVPAARGPAPVAAKGAQIVESEDVWFKGKAVPIPKGHKAVVYHDQLCDAKTYEPFAQVTRVTSVVAPTISKVNQELGRLLDTAPEPRHRIIIIEDPVVPQRYELRGRAVVPVSTLSPATLLPIDILTETHVGPVPAGMVRLERAQCFD